MMNLTELMEKMTLREKIGQTLMVNQRDLVMRPETGYQEQRTMSEAREILRSCGFGAIWLFANQDGFLKAQQYDTKKLTGWIDEISEGLPVRPICANDITGRTCCLDLGTYPMGLIVGAADSEELAYELGQCVGREHRAAGINWLWNPVLDLYSRLSTSIGRPFSNRQDQLPRLASAFAKGMQSVGVAATVKHFPGADPRSINDTHVTLSINRLSKEEWTKTQGEVFKKVIDSGVYGVMSNAGMVPGLDDTLVNGNYVPAGLSKKILVDVLRGELGFDGVVITDDTHMGGFVSCYPHDELYGRMLAAGNDMLLGVGLDAVDIVESCVERGIVTEERIEEACGRVLRLKEKLGLLDENYRAASGIDVEAARRQTADLSRRIAEKGVTLLRNHDGFLPLREKPKRVTIYSFSSRESFTDALSAMKAAFEERGAEVTLKKTPESFEEIRTAAETEDLIIYAGYIGHFAPKGLPSFYEENHWAFRYAFTAGIEKSIGVSLGYPLMHARYMKEAHITVNLYAQDARIQEAFVRAVYGEIPFTGVSPVDLESPITVII